MGFYSVQIVPRLIDWGMKSEEFEKIRKRALQEATGVVLDVGFGSGLNLPFYPMSVTKVLALEPSQIARKLSQKKVQESVVPVEFVGLTGEEIPLPDHSVDTVVTTWTLCSIPDPIRALKEMKRVLRPHGKYLFVEHGRSVERRTAWLQEKLTPIQRHLCGGCHLDREIDSLIKKSGFNLLELSHPKMKGPKIATYLYMGTATL